MFAEREVHLVGACIQYLYLNFQACAFVTAQTRTVQIALNESSSSMDYGASGECVRLGGSAIAVVTGGKIYTVLSVVIVCDVSTHGYNFPISGYL